MEILEIEEELDGQEHKPKNYANQLDHEITDEDWEAIRAFQTTQKHISEGIEKNMDNLIIWQPARKVARRIIVFIINRAGAIVRL